MKSITIRGIDDQTAELLKQKASREQKSMNQLLLEIIKKPWPGRGKKVHRRVSRS